MNPNSNWRRIGGVAVVATFALLAGACSSDKDSKAETTTTVKSDGTSETIPEPTADEAYSAKIAEFSSEIASAGTDLCAVATVTTEGPPEPTNSKQAEEAVGLYVQLLNAVAGTFPADSAAESESLRMAANTLQAEAQAAGYPPDFLSGDAGQNALSGDGYTAAMAEYQTIYQAQCAPVTQTDPDTFPEDSSDPDYSGSNGSDAESYCSEINSPDMEACQRGYNNFEDSLSG